ncbi:MAG: GntR family transcriptional regulator [Clostridium sp.]|nr:GntR family transcriptional regulator [Clostridium sp.]
MPIPKNYKAPSSSTAKERAFKQLQEWIIDGTFAPGEKINDIELSKVLQVSRTPVREALQILNVQGFVEMKPGKETVVTQINKEDLKLIIPPCSALHVLAAEFAVDNIDDSFIDELKNINENVKQCIVNKDFFSVIKYDEAFHLKIVKASKNKYIENMVNMMQGHVRRFLFYEHIAFSKRSVEEHNKIIEAFENRDKELAKKCVKTNWYRSIDEFYKND